MVHLKIILHIAYHCVSVLITAPCHFFFCQEAVPPPGICCGMSSLSKVHSRSWRRQQELLPLVRWREWYIIPIHLLEGRFILLECSEICTNLGAFLSDMKISVRNMSKIRTSVCCKYPFPNFAIKTSSWPSIKPFDESSPAGGPQPWEELIKLYDSMHVRNFQKSKFASQKVDISSWNDRCWSFLQEILQMIPTNWYVSLGSCQHLQQSFSRNRNSKCLESFGFHLLQSGRRMSGRHPPPKNPSNPRCFNISSHFFAIPKKIGLV